jgi:hypothetical protein
MDEKYLRLLEEHYLEAFLRLQEMTPEEKLACRWEDNKENLDSSFQWSMTRHGFHYWNTVSKEMEVYTKVRVHNGLKKLLDKLNIGPIKELNNYYEFTWLAVSDTDPTRISGMRRPWRNEPTPQERAEKGFYLKPGKVLSALYPGRDNIPTHADNLARLLRQENNYDFDGMNLCDTPSNIYRSKSSISSCMQGVDKELLAIYDQMPNCRILYKVDQEGYLVGRALVWNNVNEDKLTLMDRIHYVNDDVLEEFKSYARKEGWYYKDRQSTNSFDIVCPDGLVREMQLQVPVGCTLAITACPYFDTLSYYNGDNTLSSHRRDNFLTHMKSTEGGDSENYFPDACSDCGGNIYGGKGHYVDGHFLCSKCYAENYFHCEHCDCDHHNRDREKCVDGQFICSECYDENYFYCEHCDCDHHNRDGENYVDGQFLCDSCYSYLYIQCNCCNADVRRDHVIKDYRGRYYCGSCSDDELSYCGECDEYYPCDCFRETITGEYICEDCACQYTPCPECELLYHTGETCCAKEVEEC